MPLAGLALEGEDARLPEARERDRCPWRAGLGFLARPRIGRPWEEQLSSQAGALGGPGGQTVAGASGRRLRSSEKHFLRHCLGKARLHNVASKRLHTALIGFLPRYKVKAGAGF